MAEIKRLKKDIPDLEIGTIIKTEVPVTIFMDKPSSSRTTYFVCIKYDFDNNCWELIDYKSFLYCPIHKDFHNLVKNKKLTGIKVLSRSITGKSYICEPVGVVDNE